MLLDSKDLRRRPSADRARDRASAMGAAQGGVVTRGQLRAEGLPGWFLDEQVRVGRWARAGRNTLVLHNGPLDDVGKRWLAVLELGPRAALSGVSALQHAGLDLQDDGRLHVIVPKGAAPHELRGVRVHESRRFSEEDVVPVGLRRTQLAVAAVHAALWARTDREALFVLVLVVQQRRVTAPRLAQAVEAVRKHPRRALLQQAVVDLGDGMRSMGELDVATSMRRRGLPEPDRQVVRRRPSGTVVLDADFDAYGISLEVDGVQHGLPAAVLADCLRDLTTQQDGRVVARVPLLAWRVDEEAVLDALEGVFRSRGWIG